MGTPAKGLYEAFAQRMVAQYGFCNWQCETAFAAGIEAAQAAIKGLLSDDTPDRVQSSTALWACEHPAKPAGSPDRTFGASDDND